MIYNLIGSDNNDFKFFIEEDKLDEAKRCAIKLRNELFKNEEKLALSIEKITGERKKVVCTAAELRGMKLVFLPPY